MEKTLVVAGTAVVAVFVLALMWSLPIKSGDVAGWVQAFGSIAAIGLAVWLQYEARTVKERQALMVAKAFVGQVLLSLDSLHMACRQEDRIRIGAAQRGLEDALGIDVALEELSSDLLALVLTFRAIAKAVPREVSYEPGFPTPFHRWEKSVSEQAQSCRNLMLKAGLQPPDKDIWN